MAEEACACICCCAAAADCVRLHVFIHLSRAATSASVGV